MLYSQGVIWHVIAPPIVPDSPSLKALRCPFPGQAVPLPDAAALPGLLVGPTKGPCAVVPRVTSQWHESARPAHLEAVPRPCHVQWSGAVAGPESWALICRTGQGFRLGGRALAAA